MFFHLVSTFKVSILYNSIDITPNVQVLNFSEISEFSEVSEFLTGPYSKFLNILDDEMVQIIPLEN